MAENPQLDRVIQMIKERTAGVRGNWARPYSSVFRGWARLAEVRRNVDEDRLSFEKMTSEFPLPEDVETERVGVDGVAGEWIVAPGAPEDRVLLYLHGGGYVIGSVRTHRAMISRISRAGGIRALGLDYRLAPEYTFPAPVEDTISAYRWLLSRGISPRKIVIGGDSAGGGLVVAAMIALRYLGEPMPAAGVCISAWTDMEATGESYTNNAEVDPNVSKERILGIARVYMGDKDHRAPLASPIHADLHGLPPLLVQVGSIETLLDDSTVLVERAKAAGVDAKLEVWDDMPHVWPQYAHILPEAQQAIDHIGEFIKKHIG